MTTEEPPSEVTAYQIHLPSFEGPLDLLLHLIEKRQLEITTISLVAVTDQFIEYLRVRPDHPIARLADFVALASRLLVIKSRSLLPRTNRPEDEAETAEALADAEAIRRNLLEYKLAKEIAVLLRERSEAGLQSFARTTPPQGVEESLAWVPPRLTGLSVGALSAAFQRVIAERLDREPEELPLPVVTVAEKIAEIEALLAAQPAITLSDLLAEQSRRIIIVVTFIAVLELWHLHRIAVRQDDPFGEVYIERATAANTKPRGIVE
jgi:segregation and condensation protein A